MGLAGTEARQRSAGDAPTPHGEAYFGLPLPPALEPRGGMPAERDACARISLSDALPGPVSGSMWGNTPGRRGYHAGAVGAALTAPRRIHKALRLLAQIRCMCMPACNHIHALARSWQCASPGAQASHSLADLTQLLCQMPLAYCPTPSDAPAGEAVRQACAAFCLFLSWSSTLRAVSAPTMPGRPDPGPLKASHDSNGRPPRAQKAHIQAARPRRRRADRNATAAQPRVALHVQEAAHPMCRAGASRRGTASHGHGMHAQCVSDRLRSPWWMSTTATLATPSAFDRPTPHRSADGGVQGSLAQNCPT